jgi:hypothetical protein
VLLNAAGYALIIADSTVFRIAASAEQRAAAVQPPFVGAKDFLPLLFNHLCAVGQTRGAAPTIRCTIFRIAASAEQSLHPTIHIPVRSCSHQPNGLSSR